MKEQILIFLLKTAKLLLSTITLGIPQLIGIINQKIVELGGSPQILKQKADKK